MSIARMTGSGTRRRRGTAFVPTLVIGLLGAVAAQDEIRFAMVPIDGGAAESAAVADFNNDGLLDIVSAESWC